MPGTTAKTTKTPTPRASEAAEKDRAATLKSAVDRTADLSQEVFKSVEAGQRAALAAVRGFIDTVDEALPAIGERPSRRETVIDAALDMADGAHHNAVRLPAQRGPQRGPLPAPTGYRSEVDDCLRPDHCRQLSGGPVVDGAKTPTLRAVPRPAARLSPLRLRSRPCIRALPRESRG